MASGAVNIDTILSVDARGMSRGLKKAETGMSRFDKKAKKTMGKGSAAHRGAVGLTRVFRVATGSIMGFAAVAGARILGRALIGAGISLEKLRVQLQAILGSVENARIAFEGLKSLATEMPFTLQDLTSAVAVLSSRGIQPSAERLTKFADLAAAMGKTMEQVARSIVAATTIEFERLKQFGIVARIVGDQIAMTYGGVTQMVNRNAEEITQAVENIAERFKGASLAMSKTVFGAFSIMQDSFSKFADFLFKAGLRDMVVGIMKSMTLMITVARPLAESFVLLFQALGNLLKLFTLGQSNMDAFETGIVLLGSAIDGVIVLLSLLTQKFAQEIAWWLRMTKGLAEKLFGKDFADGIEEMARGLDAVGVAAGEVAIEAGLHFETLWDELGEGSDEAAKAVQAAMDKIFKALTTGESAFGGKKQKSPVKTLIEEMLELIHVHRAFILAGEKGAAVMRELNKRNMEGTTAQIQLVIRYLELLEETEGREKTLLDIAKERQEYLESIEMAEFLADVPPGTFQEFETALAYAIEQGILRGLDEDKEAIVDAAMELGSTVADAFPPAFEENDRRSC